MIILLLLPLALSSFTLDTSVLPSKSLSVRAAADANNAPSRHTDVVVVRRFNDDVPDNATASEYELAVLLYRDATSAFDDDASVRPVRNLARVPLGVQALDMDLDGNVDLVGVDADAGLRVWLRDAVRNAYVLAPAMNVSDLRGAEYALLDANGDMLPDVLGTSAETGERSFWLNRGASAAFERVAHAGAHEPLATPLDALFADMNGDCVADLVVRNAQQELEVWLNAHAADGDALKSFATVSARVALPPAAAGTLSAAADVDRDGDLDLVVPTTAGGAAALVLIHNNRQGGTDVRHRVTASLVDLCVAATSFALTVNDAVSAGLPDAYAIAGSGTGSGGGSGGGSGDALAPVSPPTVRVGDVNLDGFPDLVAVVADANATRVGVWLNNGAQRFLAQPLTPYVADAARLHLVSLLDVGDRGRLDLVVQYASAADGSRTHAAVLRNTFVTRAYHVTTYGLNSVCVDFCAPPSPRFPSPPPLGAVALGATSQFTYADEKGRVRLMVGVQLSRASHASLEPPYLLFGLGTSDNYVDLLAYGIAAAGANGTQSQTFREGVFPNARVYLVPHQLRTPLTWAMREYLHSSSVALWVLVANCLLVGVTSCVIGYFALRERREDEKERKEKSIVFTFSAF